MGVGMAVFSDWSGTRGLFLSHPFWKSVAKNKIVFFGYCALTHQLEDRGNRTTHGPTSSKMTCKNSCCFSIRQPTGLPNHCGSLHRRGNADNILVPWKVAHKTESWVEPWLKMELVVCLFHMKLEPGTGYLSLALKTANSWCDFP